MPRSSLCKPRGPRTPTAPPRWASCALPAHRIRAGSTLQATISMVSRHRRPATEHTSQLLERWDVAGRLVPVCNARALALQITNFCQSTAAAAPAPVPGMTSVARAPPPVAPPPAPAPMLALGPAPAPKRPDHPGPVTTAPTQTFPTAPPDATPSAEAATDSAPARPSAWTVTSLVLGALAIAVA